MPSEKVGRAIGTLQATQIFSAAVGPFFGGILAGWIGIRYTFLITSFMCLLNLLLFLILYRDKPLPLKPSAGRTPRKQHQSFRNLMFLPNFAALAILLFVVTTVDRGFAPVIPLFVMKLTSNAEEAARKAGIIISLAAFGESFSAWYSGRRISKVSPKQFLLWRLTFGGFVSLVLSLADTVSQLP